MSKAYYNRTMSPKIEALLQEENGKYHWMIDYVKKHRELDFQTGSNNVDSWFSIYRGTGRVLTISKSGKVTADAEYVKLCPELYENPSPILFDKLLGVLRYSDKFKRYYADAENGSRKEGYYQTLIARRYTFNVESTDDFIIIDKELVIGFKDKKSEEEWNAPISSEIREDISKLRSRLNKTRLPSVIKDSYGEFDFLGLNWAGDIIIMELKQNDPTKTYLSPVQVSFYHKQFAKLIDELPGLYKDIIAMINQKVKLGLITIPQGRELPSRLSGRIKEYLIVGEDKPLSKEICRRYKEFRHFLLPELEAYTCDEYGSLLRSKKLDD